MFFLYEFIKYIYFWNNTFKYCKSDKEFEIQGENNMSSIIEKDTIFQIEKVDNKMILKELDELNEILFAGNYITFNEEQWAEYKGYFSCLS